VVICRPARDAARGDGSGSADDTWDIDTWLMSCRVLGRKVEEMVLSEVLAHAARCGVTRLVGRYVPTDRNALVKDHYAKLGFTPIGELDNGTTVWEIATDARNPVPHFAVHRIGFDVELPA
jgi:predicted enzyme involved in methoxymalonyl-ACP biosynthesis